MITRCVGRDGPSVPAIGFGAMGLSSGYGSVGTDEERFRILDEALALGSTFWDTSDVCMLKNCVSKLMILTKYRCRQ